MSVDTVAAAKSPMGPVEKTQSIDFVRKYVTKQPTLCFWLAVLLALGAGLLFLIASAERSLPRAIGFVVAAVLCGVFALLLVNELLVQALSADAAARSATARGLPTPPSGPFPDELLRTVFGRHRFRLLALLTPAILLGIWGRSLPGLSWLGFTIRGTSLGALLTVIALVALTVWVQAWLLHVERGVLVFPELWLWGGLGFALAGALVWAMGWGRISIGGALVGIAGLSATKMALLPMVERVTSVNGELPPRDVVEQRRNVRAVDLIAAGAVVAAGGAMMMRGGAASQRASFLTLGLLAAIIGLSLAGVAAVCIDFASTTRRRLFGTAAIALGVLLSLWGAMQSIEAAGDWLWMVLVLAAILVTVGAWFVFRGEGIVALALVTFVLVWAMHDRETQQLADLDQGGPGGPSALVAIGDSFMSGEGASDFIEGTNAPETNQCRRALTAYSALVAKQLHYAYETFACSGAKMENVRLGGVAQMPDSPPDVAGGQTQLTDVAALVPHADVRVVLLSIGGNDTGFSSIIQACLLPTNCAENEDLYIAKAESLQDDLADVYREIDQATGNAIVVVVPYPDYILPTACDRLASGEEFEFVSRFIDALNNTIARAAADADVLVANTSGVFKGRTQCDKHPAANLVVLAPPGGASILQRLSPANWVHGTMHPYDPGHVLQAEKLLPLLTRLTADCPTDDDCRPHCSGTPSDTVAALWADERGLIVDTCGAPIAMTPPGEAARRVEGADVILKQGVVRDLYTSAGLVIWPFMALVAGGLLIALGLINRQGALAKLAMFLAPIRSPIPSVHDDDTVHVVSLASERDRVTLLAVVTGSRANVPKGAVEVELVADADPGQPRLRTGGTFVGWVYFAGGRHSFWWSKLTICDLKPGTPYRVVVDGGADVGTTVVTLPAPDATGASIIVGSCYYRANPVADEVSLVYQNLTGDRAPVLNFWLGDQVYVDKPWRNGLRVTDLREQVAKRYLDTWEIGAAGSYDPEDRPIPRDPARRFGFVLRQSSNRFLPDDHEFWAGYPGISYRTLPRHALARQRQQLLDRVGDGPRTRTSHPAQQGPFGEAAGLAYLIFQSSLSQLTETLGDDQSPKAIQRIDIGRQADGSTARILMIDTRWRRTVHTRPAGTAGFLLPRDIDDLERQLQAPGLVLVMLSRPLAGYPPVPRRRRFREQVIEHYCEQYDHMCRLVVQRARTQPTAVIAGDVHHYALYTAGQGSLLQIVSSPIVMRGRAHRSHNPFAYPDLIEGSDGWHRGGPQGEVVVDLSTPGHNEGGLVRLDVELSGASGPSIGFRHLSVGSDREVRRDLVWLHQRWHEPPGAIGTQIDGGAATCSF